jgi:hypothetical protein
MRINELGLSFFKPESYSFFRLNLLNFDDRKKRERENEHSLIFLDIEQKKVFFVLDLF